MIPLAYIDRDYLPTVHVHNEETLRAEKGRALEMGQSWYILLLTNICVLPLGGGDI